MRSGVSDRQHAVNMRVNDGSTQHSLTHNRYCATIHACLRQLNNSKNSAQARQGSLAYHNRSLRNCTVSEVTIEFEGLQRSAYAIAVQRQRADLPGYVEYLFPRL